MQEINLKNVKLHDGFWSPFQDKIIDMVIPYQEKILRDEIADAEKSHAIANFRIAAGLEEGEFYGMVFQDSDMAKWLEGAAYSLRVRENKELEARLDEVIEIIRKAQQPDGYLDTYFIIKEPDKKWQNLLEGHELYCAGHMIEAGVAYYEATGKTVLLDVCRRLADHIDRIFRLNGRPGYPGHPEIELACMKLYRATGEERYMLLAKHFLDERGADPDFFRREREARDFQIWGMDPDNHIYNQSFAPVREQKEAVGHAVRAMYLYEAMADVAAATGDEEMMKACQALWSDAAERKMSVTGGIGSVGNLEAFSEIPYYLPNDTAYNETCAQIGLMFFSKKMLDAGIMPDGKYADVMELLLYNSTISGIQFDGTRFFYVNPLEVNPQISGKVWGHEHVVPTRPRWYACACCPPNLVRMVTSLGKYTLSQETNKIYSHLMIGLDADLPQARIHIDSDYPWKGQVRYEISARIPNLEFAFHIPGYVKKYRLLFNGEDITENTVVKNGYVYLKGFGKTEDGKDIIEITFDLPVRRIYADERILADGMKTAYKRGPIVYCFEGVDHNEKLHLTKVREDTEITEIPAEQALADIRIAEDSTVTKDSLKNVVCLDMQGICYDVKLEEGEKLYTENRPVKTACTLTAIPYYLWGNRGETQMRVWMEEQ